jgi:hypothetical protein
MTEPLFHEGFQRPAFLICKLAGLFQEAVRYLFIWSTISNYRAASQQEGKESEVALLQKAVRYLNGLLHMVR